jgi:hypothetical protein
MLGNKKMSYLYYIYFTSKLYVNEPLSRPQHKRFIRSRFIRTYYLVNSKPVSVIAVFQ